MTDQDRAEPEMLQDHSLNLNEPPDERDEGLGISIQGDKIVQEGSVEEPDVLDLDESPHRSS